jgi:cell division inhibitor SepF
MSYGRFSSLQFYAAWFAAVSGINHGLARRAIVNRLVSTEVSVVPRNARARLGRVEHDNDALVNQDEYAYDGSGETLDETEAMGGQFATGYGVQIAIVRPRNFQDAATVGDYFRQEIPVIVNLEDMENVEAGRIIDFVSGLVLGLCGDIERVSRRTFLIVPGDATMITTHHRSTREGFFNQA